MEEPSQSEHLSLLLWLLAPNLLLFWLVVRLYQPATAHEELQTGGIAFEILKNGSLPLEFRFTNMVAYLGFLVGEVSLLGLRTPFLIIGALALTFFLNTCRKYFGSFPVYCFVLSYVSLPIIVLSIMYADEIFFGHTLSLVILSTALKINATRRISFLDALIGGGVAGMLLYEYAAYKPISVVFLLFIVWAATSKSFLIQTKVLPQIGLFSFSFLTLSWEAVWSVYVEHTGSILFDAQRHLSGLAAQGDFLSRGLERALDLIKFVFGAQASDEGMVPDGYGAIPLAFGALLVLGLLFGAWYNFLTRIMAITTIICIFVAAMFAPNIHYPRLIAPLLMIVIIGVIGFHQTWSTVSGRRHVYICWVVMFILSSLTIHSGVRSALGVHENSRFMAAHGHSDFYLCMHLLRYTSRNVTEVFFYSPENFGACNNHHEGRWLFRDQLKITPIHSKVEATQVALNGKHLVVGQRHGLTTDQLHWIQSLCLEHALNCTDRTVSLVGVIESASMFQEKE